MVVSQLSKIIGEIIGVKKNIEQVLATVLNKENFPIDKLSQWLKEKKQGWIKFLIGVVVILSISNIVYLFNDEIFKEASFGYNYISVIHVVHLIVILIAATNIVLNPYKAKFNFTGELKIASTSTQNLLTFWLYIWVAWFFLYLLQVGGAFEIDAFKKISEHLPAVANLLNNLTGVFLFAMFYEMYEKTVISNTPQQGNKTGVLGIMILAIIFVLELAVVNNEASKFIFATISGVFVGICTLLVVTRLSSIIFKVPFWAIFFLAAYAIIQPIYPFLEEKVAIEGIDSKKMAIMVSTFALYGKLVLLMVVHWCKDTERLFYYLLRAGNLYREENEDDFRKNIMLTIDKLQKEEKEK